MSECGELGNGCTKMYIKRASGWLQTGISHAQADMFALLVLGTFLQGVMNYTVAKLWLFSYPSSTFLACLLFGGTPLH